MAPTTLSRRDKAGIACAATIAVTFLVGMAVTLLAPPQAQAHIAWHSLRVHFLEADAAVFLAACVAGEIFASHRRRWTR